MRGLWNNQGGRGRDVGGGREHSNCVQARRGTLGRRPEQLRRGRRHRHQDAGQGPRERSVLRLERPLFRRPCRVQPRQRASRSRRARPDQLSQVVRQPQRRHPGWLQPRAAFASASGRRGRPVRLERSVGGRACVVSHHGRHRPRREDRVDGNAARPRRLRVRPLDDLRDWRVRVVAGTLYSNAGRRRRDRPGPASPHRLVGRCRNGSRARAELDAPAGISLSEFRTGRRRVPVGRDGRLVVRHPHRPRGSELQDRRPQRECLDRQLRRLVANPIRQLGDPRPDDLHPARLSGLPVAVSRREQLHAVGANAADLDRQRLSRPAAVGRRRALLQSGAAAGLRAAQHFGRRRLPERRSPEVEFSVSTLQHVTPVRAADAGVWRRAGIGRKRVRPDGPEARRIAAHRPGRKIRRP